MVGVMSKLAINGLHDRMGFAANGHRTLQILLGERSKRSEYTLPALFPDSEQCFMRSGGISEFSVPIAVRLLSIAGQKVCPSRSHVARHVLHNDGNGIHLTVQYGEQLFVCYLRHRSFGQVFVITEQVK